MVRVALSLLAGLGLAGAALATCEPWPGEPKPLPTLSDADPLRSEWASLRAEELAAVARRFEGHDDRRAQQLWRHLLCIDPDNEDALAGVLRTAAVRLHRPELRDAPFDAARVSDPWRSLSQPIGVRTVERVDPEDRADELFAAVRALDEAVRRAHFESAIESAEALRTELEEMPPGSSRVGLLVETEVLAATAELALGREDEAIAGLRRALRLFPSLELDPAKTSPKVLRALETARRAERGEGEGSP